MIEVLNILFRLVQTPHKIVTENRAGVGIRFAICKCSVLFAK